MPIILPPRRRTVVSTTGTPTTTTDTRAGATTAPRARLLAYPGSASAATTPYFRVTPLAAAVSSAPDDMAPGYDLVADLTENLRAYSDRDHWFTLYNLPRYVSWHLDRILVDTKLPVGPAFVACMSFGLDRLAENDVYESWCQLRQSALMAHYSDASDFAYVQGCLSAIRLTTHDGATGLSRRKFRCPEGVIDQVNEMAGNLGLSGRSLAVVATMDAIRLQERCDIEEHRLLMDAHVDELYTRLAKQRDRLAAVLHAVTG